MHRDLKQQVTKLFLELLVVSGVDRLQNLVGLFQQIRTEGLVRLLTIPGTSPGSAQARDDFEQRAQTGRVRRLL